MTTTTGMSPEGSDPPLGLLLVDGPNVMIKIKELWENAPDGRPSNFGLHYDTVAQFLREKFSIAEENFQKSIFIKKVSETGRDDESVDRQDKFRFALERDRWDVQVRAPAEGTEYSDKSNDIDDDLMKMAAAFLEEAQAGDVLIIMTNDFALTPDGNSTIRVMENARRLGLKTAIVAFTPVAPEIVRKRIEIIDSRDIPDAYDVPPPRVKTIADVEPGTIESFDRYAVKVIGRRPSKVPASNDNSLTSDSNRPSEWTPGESGTLRRVIPPPPGPHSPRQARSEPREPSALHQEILGAPIVPSSTWTK